MQLYSFLNRSLEHVRKPDTFLHDLKEIATENDRHGYAGILLFTTLDDVFDQWSLAAVISERSRQIPLIALNPNWEHPIITARKIVSFQEIYQRPCAINWITGTLNSHYEKLGLELDPVQRYAKLDEYIFIVSELLKGKSLSFEGSYFKIKGHKLSYRSPYPIVEFIAGASESCSKLAEKYPHIKQISQGMPIHHRYHSTVKGASLGFLVRESEEEAFAEFQKVFPENRFGELHLEKTKEGTHSAWKHHLLNHRDGELGKSGFFTSPLKNYAEQGFFVGSYAEANKYIEGLRRRGLDTLFTSLVDAKEIAHLKAALKWAGSQT